MERFIKEYANHKLRELNTLSLIHPEQKELYAKRIRRVTGTVASYSFGHIIADEAIRIILESGEWDDD